MKKDIKSKSNSTTILIIIHSPHPPNSPHRILSACQRLEERNPGQFKIPLRGEGPDFRCRTKIDE
jgi:hypothetical protein